jgi:hypothetical protein
VNSGTGTGPVPQGYAFFAFFTAFFAAFLGAAFFTAFFAAFFLTAFFVAIVVILPFPHYETNQRKLHHKSSKMF